MKRKHRRILFICSWSEFLWSSSEQHHGELLRTKIWTVKYYIYLSIYMSWSLIVCLFLYVWSSYSRVARTERLPHRSVPTHQHTTLLHVLPSLIRPPHSRSTTPPSPFYVTHAHSLSQPVILQLFHVLKSSYCVPFSHSCHFHFHSRVPVKETAFCSKCLATLQGVCG